MMGDKIIWKSIRAEYSVSDTFVIEDANLNGLEEAP